MILFCRSKFVKSEYRIQESEIFLNNCTSLPLPWINDIHFITHSVFFLFCSVSATWTIFIVTYYFAHNMNCSAFQFFLFFFCFLQHEQFTQYFFCLARFICLELFFFSSLLWKNVFFYLCFEQARQRCQSSTKNTTQLIDFYASWKLWTKTCVALQIHQYRISTPILWIECCAYCILQWERQRQIYVTWLSFSMVFSTLFKPKYKHLYIWYGIYMSQWTTIFNDGCYTCFSFCSVWNVQFTCDLF